MYMLVWKDYNTHCNSEENIPLYMMLNTNVNVVGPATELQMNNESSQN